MGEHGDIRQKLITALHDSQLGGHFGIQASFIRANQLFYWPRMYKAIKKVVLECDVCRKYKDEHVAYPGLLQPLLVPQYSWSHVPMDFIQGLPGSEGKDTIMVVMNKFTKYSHFISLTHPFDASKIARIFIDDVNKFHGIPQSMLSDGDEIFISQFWGNYSQCWESNWNITQPITLKQMDKLRGLVLEMYLRCRTHSEPKK